MKTSAIRRWLREQREAENAARHGMDLMLAAHEIAAEENARQWMGDTRWFGVTDDGASFEWFPGRGCRALA